MASYLDKTGLTTLWNKAKTSLPYAGASAPGGAATSSNQLVISGSIAWKTAIGAKAFYYDNNGSTYAAPYSNSYILTLSDGKARGTALGISWQNDHQGLYYNNLHDDTQQSNWAGWIQVLDTKNYSSYAIAKSKGVNMLGDISSTDSIGDNSCIFRTTSAAPSGFPSTYAVYTRFRSHTSGSYDLWLSANSSNLFYAFSADGGFPTTSWKTVLTSSNYSSYVLPISGGTLTGSLTVAGAVAATGTIYGSNCYVKSNSYPSYVLANADGTVLAQLYVETNNGGYAGTILRVYSASGTYFNYGFTTNGTIGATTFNGNATTASGLIITKFNTSWKANTAGNIICYEGASTTTYDLPTGAVEILSMRHNGSRGVALGIGWASGGRGVWFNSLHDDTSQDQWLGWRRLIDSSQFSWNSSTSTLTITI